MEYRLVILSIELFVFGCLQVKLQNVTRLCNTRAIPTVNGKFPGPKIVTREGDRVVVKVVNNIKDNITIHWSAPCS